MDIPTIRLENQRITAPHTGGPTAVVRGMGAMQAQDPAQAAWAIGVRSASTTIGDVDRAVADGTIVRTWPMRGTLHYVPAEDARWMLGLSEARMISSTRRRREGLGLDDAMLRRCFRLFSEALAGGARLSRSGMMRLLAEAGIDPGGQRGYHVLWYASQVGLICLGPKEGSEYTFVLLDDWVPRSTALARDEALAELATRYVVGHGPATVHDFAWWAGLTVGDARLGIGGAMGAVTRVPFRGKDYWVADGLKSPVPDQSRPPTVHLLPGFDEYLLGYRDRDAVIDFGHAAQIVPGGNGVFLPMVVVGGQVAGTWTRRVKGGAVEVTVSPFGDLDHVEDRVTAAATAYAAFLGLPLAGSVVAMER